MEPTQTDVNASQAGAESPQAQPEVQAPDTGVTAASAEQQPEKQVQSPEENARYKAIRVKAEQEATAKAAAEWQTKLDEFSQAAYGMSHADYLAAKRKAEYQEKYNVDVDAIKPLVDEAVENHPMVLEARERATRLAYDQNAAVMATKYPEANVKTGEDLIALVESEPEIGKRVKMGLSPSEAYWLVKGEDILKARETKAAQDTIAKIQTNAGASPGPVGQAADTPQHYSPEQVKKMSREDVRKNWSAVQESMKKWK